MAGPARRRDTPLMDDETGIQSHEVTVPRTSRYVVLGAGVSAPAELWLVCHGYGQLASRFIRRFGVLDNGKRMIVAPEALSRFYVTGGSGPHSEDDVVGASWMTREARDAEIDDQIIYLDTVVERVLGATRRQDVPIVALGFSQGAGTICRWAARTAVPPRRVILWGSGVPADLLEGEGRAGLLRAPLTIVVGDRDPIADSARVNYHKQQLEVAAIQYHFVAYNGGHEIDGEVLTALAAESAGHA
jgi:predicted esterase